MPFPFSKVFILYDYLNIGTSENGKDKLSETPG
jgi:hypothetical protein